MYENNHNETHNTLGTQNSQYLNVKLGGTYGYHLALKYYNSYVNV
jgi:hypothetical protein